MDSNLRDDMDATIEKGKAQTEATRAEVKAQADQAREDIEARTEEANAVVHEHFGEVRKEAEQLDRPVEREREGTEERLVEMLDDAREREANRANAPGVGERIAHQAHERLDDAKGLIGKVKGRIIGDNQ